MKIGIMTWFSYENYGTALQAYALQRFLRSKGYECELLNYLPENSWKQYGSIKKRSSIKNFKYKVIWKKNKLMFNYINLNRKTEINNRSKLFVSFIQNNCILTSEVKDGDGLMELNKKFDTYICGSDQIWTPNALDGTYYLDFVDDNNKRISYAPSFGVIEIPSEYKNIVREWISKFDFLSVREIQGGKIIKELTNMEYSVVLDPTLLLNSDEWESVSNNINIDEPYILCYFLGDKSSYWKHVKKVKKITGYRVVIIPVMPESYIKRGTILSETGPSEFVGLIKNAQIILTDSFHGTIFSINFKRDFYVFKRFNDSDKGSQNSRIYNILEKLNLENRLILNNDDISVDSIHISNFNDVDLRLKKERDKSIEFLMKSLEN